MVRTTESLHQSLDALAKREKAFAKVLKDHGKQAKPERTEGRQEALRIGANRG